jgi:predicted RNase H-like nuclease (RuvC/YqgF family)
MTDAIWQARVHDRDREIEDLNAEIAALRRQLVDADGYIADLEHQLRHQNRPPFG